MRTTNRHLPHLLSLSLAAALLAACGPASEPSQPIATDDLGTGAQALSADNGLSTNGLNRNGLNRNGLNRNGLDARGLNLNGLGTTLFNTWFNQDVATSSAVMKYLYACAAASGSTLTWTNPTTGVSYTWSGVLGLATGWAGGTPATVVEQQVITACLAAHVNKYGLSVPIAVEGRGATGAQIPILPGELTTYSVQEGCFFGNIFNGEGVFMGLIHPVLDPAVSSARACSLESQPSGPSINCPPVYHVGKCSAYCRLDATKTFPMTCTYNGITYRPLSTRIRPAERYVCGDGVCQFTEQCGTGTTADSCKTDCGLCP